MIRKLLVTIALITGSVVRVAHAEGGCPPGQYPQNGQGWQTCVPIPGGNGAANSAQPVHVPSKWISNWQAIATDANKGALGTSIDKPTGDAAQAAAIADCKGKGGLNCQVQISYANGCVAMAVGSSLMNTRGGANKRDAEQSALTKCSQEDKGCRIYYSQCSLPIEVPE